MTFFSKIRIAALTLAVIALGAGTAKAETPVAVIDMMKVIEQSAAGKDLQAKFKVRRDVVQKDALAYEEELRSKEKSLMAERKTLDQDAFNKKRASYETALKKKRQEVVAKNASLEKAKNAALASIQKKVAQICADVAEAKKIQVVLDRNAVVIAQQSLDITADVIKKLDEDMKTVTLK